MLPYISRKVRDVVDVTDNSSAGVVCYGTASTE
jgi:hypothetical protein